MLRKVTWRSWALLGALFAAYIVLGLTWTPRSGTEEWIYKTGSLGATFAPLLLIGIYMASGNRFWTNDVGSALVQLALSIAIIAGPLAWASWLDKGSITGGMVAWLEIAGPVLITLAILRLCWVFLRVHRDGEKGALWHWTACPSSPPTASAARGRPATPLTGSPSGHPKTTFTASSRR